MGAWYRAGTASVTNGSTAVTGVQTLWSSQCSQGDMFSLDGDKFYEIQSVTDDTHLVLATPFLGATASAQVYEIIRNFTSTTNAQLAANLAGMLDQWHQYLDDMLGWLGGTGTVTVHDANGIAHTVKTPQQMQTDMATAEITNGTIDGAVIGAATPAAGNFTVGTFTTSDGSTPLKTQSVGSTANAANLAIFGDGGSSTPGNLYSIGINKGGVDVLYMGINKNTATGNIPANATFISTYGSSSVITIGRGNPNANLPNNNDITVWGDGRVTIGTGATNNGSDSFQVPGGNIAAAGIRLNGGSAALSAYEEGSFTPSVVGQATAGANTYGVRTGTYTRIGRMVYAKFTVQLTAKDAAMAGAVAISGLPYAANNGGSSYNEGAMGQWSNLGIPAGYTDLYLEVAPGQTIANINRNGPGVTAQNVSATEATGTTAFSGTCIYNI